MSYILDALKKMEREKVKKARAGGMTNISGELFNEERPRSYRGGAWKIIAVAIVTSCVAMAATWYYLKPDSDGEKTAARRSADRTVPAAINAAPVTPQPPAPVPATVQPSVPPAAAVPGQPAAQMPPSTASLQQSPAPTPGAAPPVPAVSVPGVQPPLRKADSRRGTAKTVQSAPRPEQRPAVATVAPPADLKVSGIAWQEERSARRVVANGFLLKEGNVVAGARIVEILPDRVRFSMSGGEFELSMVASGIPGATK